MQTALSLAAELRMVPWALTASAHVALRAMAEAAMVPGAVAAASPRRAQATGPRGATALIPIIGIIEQRPGWLSDVGIGTACSQVSAAMNDALADPSVRSIVFYVDSPGGSVFGVQELADEIFAARGKKPMVAVCEGQAGSAAYWLASQVPKFYASVSSQAGSIGAYAAHSDISGAMAQRGEKVTLVSAGRFKTEGNPFEPLSPESRAHMQAQVDQYNAMFVASVARGRNVTTGTVRVNMGEGRMLGAAQALKANMIDGIASLRDVIAGGAGARTGAAGEHAIASARAAAARRLQCELAIAEVTCPELGTTAEARRRLLQIEADIARVS